ncbi:MAG: hypothetical protein AAGJ31_02465 [Verrucomicrobiota bacterium]
MAFVSVRRRTRSDGDDRWLVDIRKDGERRRLHFRTKEEANKEARRIRAELDKYGELAAELSYRQRVRLVELEQEIISAGATLEEAVEFFLAHKRKKSQQVSLRDALQLLLEDRKERGASERYRKALKSTLGGLGRFLDWPPLEAITESDLERWLDSNGWSYRTKKGYLTDVKTLFNFAKEKGWTALPPPIPTLAKPISPQESEVEFLPLRDVELLLSRCLADEPEFLGYVVFGLFCGLRPDRELGLMRWDDYQEETGDVFVSATRAKTRRRRIVPLREVGKSYLPFAIRGWDTVAPKRNFKRRWENLRKGIQWPHDAMRHTFATFHFSHFRNEALLQAEMGHANPDLLHRHYRGLVTPSEAKKFWDLRPKG